MRRRAFLGAFGTAVLAGCARGIGSTPAPEDATNTDERIRQPAPTSTPRPGQREFEGVGRRVTGRFPLPGGLTAFDLRHDGKRAFVVTLYDADTGGPVSDLVDWAGAWRGRIARHVDPGEYSLDVIADGAWSVSLPRLRSTPGGSIGVPFEAAGAVPDVVGPISFPGDARIRGAYRGRTEFLVRVLSADGRLLDIAFNETGGFRGETTFPDETRGWLAVEAVGDWSLSVEAAGERGGRSP